jgi:hypothetical protein
VPFYFLPYVGGVDTVRSFHEFRFRDENALWMTAEYDLTLIKWVSVATFVDAGKAAPDWQDINLTGPQARIRLRRARAFQPPDIRPLRRRRRRRRRLARVPEARFGF